MNTRGALVCTYAYVGRQCTGGLNTQFTHPYCWIDLSNKLREDFNSLIGYSDTALTVKIGNT